MPNNEDGLLNYRYPFCDIFVMSSEDTGMTIRSIHLVI